LAGDVRTLGELISGADPARIRNDWLKLPVELLPEAESAGGGASSSSRPVTGAVVGEVEAINSASI
jgi:hypothetical protein